jgi:hypothetical protein
MDYPDHLIRLADLHPFLAFCELWVIGCVAGVIGFTIRRFLRALTVLLRGWPPAHLDVDGDRKSKP